MSGAALNPRAPNVPCDIRLLKAKSKTLPCYSDQYLYRRVSTNFGQDEYSSTHAAKYLKTSVESLPHESSHPLQDLTNQLSSGLPLVRTSSQASSAAVDANGQDSGLEENSSSSATISPFVEDRSHNTMMNTADAFCDFLSEDTRHSSDSKFSFTTQDENSQSNSKPSNIKNLINSKIVKPIVVNTTSEGLEIGSPLPKPLLDSLNSLKKPILETRKRNFDNFKLHSQISRQNEENIKQNNQCLDIYQTPDSKLCPQVATPINVELQTKDKDKKEKEKEKDVKLLKVKSSTVDNFKQKSKKPLLLSKKDDKKLQAIDEDDKKSKVDFLKSIEPKSFIEWSDDTNQYLTLQNYMTSLRMTKCKFPSSISTPLSERHPELEGRMRGILLDWLMEVCDCFHLQRSTFYLAQAYLDMYLAKTGNQPPESDPPPSEEPTKKPRTKASKTKPTDAKDCVGKSQLQLLGITCLFVAAKIEEIELPKLERFAFITDGACSASDIVLQELTLLQGLSWLTHPVTSYDWLRLYIQTTYFYLVKKRGPREQGKSNGKDKEEEEAKQKTSKDSKKTGKGKKSTLNDFEVCIEYIEHQAFTPIVFAQMCQLLDLATLDVNCLKFKPHELAASILYHFSSSATSKKASNLNMNSLIDCVSWLTHKAMTLRDHGLLKKPTEYHNQVENPTEFRKAPPKEWYNLQIHEPKLLELLDEAKDRQKTVEGRASRREK